MKHHTTTPIAKCNTTTPYFWIVTWRDKDTKCTSSSVLSNAGDAIEYCERLESNGHEIEKKTLATDLCRYLVDDKITKPFYEG